MSLSPPLPSGSLGLQKGFSAPTEIFSSSRTLQFLQKFSQNSYKENPQLLTENPLFFTKILSFPKLSFYKKFSCHKKTQQLQKSSAVPKLSFFKNSAFYKNSVFYKNAQLLHKKNPQLFQELSAAAKVFSFPRNQGKTQVNTFLLQFLASNSCLHNRFTLQVGCRSPSQSLEG